MKLAACALATLATAATLVLATQQASAQGYYERQEQDRQRLARDAQQTRFDRGREEYQRQKWLADKNAEAAAEKRGDWKAAQGYAKAEDMRAQKYWNDRHQVARDTFKTLGDRAKCRRDGGC